MPDTNRNPAIQVTVRDLDRVEHTLTYMPGVDIHTLRIGGPDVAVTFVGSLAQIQDLVWPISEELSAKPEADSA